MNTVKHLFRKRAEKKKRGAGMELPALVLFDLERIAFDVVEYGHGHPDVLDECNKIAISLLEVSGAVENLADKVGCAVRIDR